MQAVPRVWSCGALRLEHTMIHRSRESSSFEFVKVASLRAAQLMRGCTARVPAAAKAVVTAQLEVASGKVHAIRPPLAPGMSEWPE